MTTLGNQNGSTAGTGERVVRDEDHPFGGIAPTNRATRPGPQRRASGSGSLIRPGEYRESERCVTTVNSYPEVAKRTHRNRASADIRNRADRQSALFWLGRYFRLGPIGGPTVHCGP